MPVIFAPIAQVTLTAPTDLTPDDIAIDSKGGDRYTAHGWLIGCELSKIYLLSSPWNVKNVKYRFLVYSTNNGELKDYLGEIKPRQGPTQFKDDQGDGYFICAVVGSPPVGHSFPLPRAGNATGSGMAVTFPWHLLGMKPPTVYAKVAVIVQSHS